MFIKQIIANFYFEYNVLKNNYKENYFMNNIVTTPVSVRFSQELNSMLSTVVEENNTTKTDFIRQAVVEKLRICMI